MRAADCLHQRQEEVSAAYTVGTDLGISKAAMDTGTKPGDDFYAYANGNWDKATEIPADRSSIGAFYVAQLETEKRNRELVDAIVKGDAAADTNEGRIAAFYKAYTDTKAIDAAGMKPVATDLARFAAITDKAGLSKVLGEQLRADVDPLNATNFQTENLFGVFVTQGLATPGEDHSLSAAGRPRHARARILSVGRSQNGEHPHRLSGLYRQAADRRRSGRRRREGEAYL